MPTILSTLSRRDWNVLSLGLLSVVGSFVVGVQTAGDVQPISLIEAGSMEQVGDMDGDGVLTIADAIRILEIAQGYVSPTPSDLRADPSEDGVLTVDDALEVLSRISIR